MKKEMPDKTRLRKLYALRDKFREEKLGQEDPEYRELCNQYIVRISEEINTLKKKLYHDMASGNE